jgi:hypothetical protein
MYTKLFVPFLKMNNLHYICIDIYIKRDRNNYMEKKEMNKLVDTAAVTRHNFGHVVSRVRWEDELSVICFYVFVCNILTCSVILGLGKLHCLLKGMAKETKRGPKQLKTSVMMMRKKRIGMKKWKK